MTERSHIKGMRGCVQTLQAHVANLKTMTKNQVKLRQLNVLQDMARHMAKAIDELDTPKQFGIPRVKRCK